MHLMKLLPTIAEVETAAEPEFELSRVTFSPLDVQLIEARIPATRSALSPPPAIPIAAWKN
jgi:hypothetical protein